MKNKKIMITIILIICFLIIMLLIVNNELKKEKNNNTNNYNNQLKNANSIIENVNNEIKEENKVSNILNNSSNEQSVKTPNHVYKELLSDENWVKKNLYLKTDCFGKNISNETRQTPTFIKVDEDGFSAPMVIVYTECNSNMSNQCFILTYKDGEIEVKTLNENSNHISHTQYDVNIRNKVLYKQTIYSQSEEYEIYNLTDNGVKLAYTLKMTTQTIDSKQVKTYYINNEASTEQAYNNIKNEYLTQTMRKEKFSIISSKNLEQKFQ